MTSLQTSFAAAVVIGLCLLDGRDRRDREGVGAMTPHREEIIPELQNNAPARQTVIHTCASCKTPYFNVPKPVKQQGVA